MNDGISVSWENASSATLKSCCCDYMKCFYILKRRKHFEMKQFGVDIATCFKSMLACQ